MQTAKQKPHTIPGVKIVPGQRCAHSKAPLIYFAEVWPGFKGVFIWKYGGLTLTGNPVSITPDFISKPGTVTVEFLPDGSFLGVSAMATLTYCSRADGGGAWWPDWAVCPHMTDCGGCWCSPCGGYWFHYSHADPGGGWAEEGWPCPVCGLLAWNFTTGCPWHTCLPHALGAGNGSGFRFRTGYHLGIPGGEAVICPIPVNGLYGCCPCPSHNTVRVTDGRLASSAAGLTHLRKVVNGTNVTYHVIPVGSAIAPGEAVYVRGTAYSYNPWDMAAVFDWKEHGVTHALTCGVTVASMCVTLEPDENATIAEGVDARLALPPEGLGVPAAPGTLTPLRLHSDVILPPNQQYIILSMTGTAGAFRIFKHNSTNDTPLLVVGQTITNGLPVSFAATGHVTVWLEALAPGTAQITYAYDGTGVSEGITHADTLNIVAQSPIQGYRVAGNYSVTHLIKSKNPNSRTLEF
jgi:hypothetical protein